jgi:NADPH:quinone reductase-like Zn-dependent oxidoreductase
MQKGEIILVHAVAGGVGTATVQLAKHLGGLVIATAGTEEKVRIARDQGADHAVNYRTADFSTEVDRVTEGHGVDVVMDSVGGRVFRKSWRLLAGMGRYVLFGLSSISGNGRLNLLRVLRSYAWMFPVFPPALISANKALLAFNLGTLTGKEEYFREAGTKLLELQRSGVFRPVIGRTFRFEEIGEAHRALQTGNTYGKVVVTLDHD